MMFILESISRPYEFSPRLLAQSTFVFFTELGYTLIARNRKLFSRVLFRKSEQ